MEGEFLLHLFMVGSGFSHGFTLVPVPREQAVSVSAQVARRRQSRPEQPSKQTSPRIMEKGARHAQALPVLQRHQITTLTRPYHSIIEQF